jgi:hypothetical protein
MDVKNNMVVGRSAWRISDKGGPAFCDTTIKDFLMNKCNQALRIP